MSSRSKHLLNIPEYLLILAVFAYWVSTSVLFNPFAILFLLGLALQLVYKNRTVGILIPSFLLLICFYLFFALVSEFKEFPSFNAEARQFLTTGLILLFSTSTTAGFMLYKYLSRQHQVD